MPEARWLDFSGAPPLLIPRSLVPFWRGTTDASTGLYREFDEDAPVTDYDRACAAAWPGRAILEFRGVQILALYTESDRHSWDGDKRIVACSAEWPSDEALQQASWTDPIQWHTKERSLLLMNSAADGNERLRDDDFIVLELDPGSYTVETSHIAFDYFHRFTRTEA